MWPPPTLPGHTEQSRRRHRPPRRRDWARPLAKIGLFRPALEQNRIALSRGWLPSPVEGFAAESLNIACSAARKRRPSPVVCVASNPQTRRAPLMVPATQVKSPDHGCAPGLAGAGVNHWLSGLKRGRGTVQIPGMSWPLSRLKPTQRRRPAENRPRQAVVNAWCLKGACAFVKPSAA